MKVRRKISPSALVSPIMIILQAPARDQVRLSGVQFHNVHGEMGRSGKYLETRVFNKIGLTLSPLKSNLQMVYSTDSVHCFPSINKQGGDIKPNGQEVAECSQYLMKEISIIKPKAIVVFGRPSADTISNIANLEKNINLDCQLRIWKTNKSAIKIFFMPHPTSMVPNKGKIFDALSEALSKCLNA